MSRRDITIIAVLAGLGLLFLTLGVIASGGDDAGDPVAAPSSPTTTVGAAETTVAPAPAPSPTPPPPATSAAPAPSPTPPPPATTEPPSATTEPPPAPTTSAPPQPAPTTTAAPPETPQDFLALLVEGLRGDAALLVSRLNQATIDIYGEEQCLATFAQVLDPDTEITIREVGDPGPWEYVIDGIVTPLEDVLPIEVERLVNGQTIIQELHWKLVDGRWTWFSDCGDPLAA